MIYEALGYYAVSGGDTGMKYPHFTHTHARLGFTITIGLDHKKRTEHVIEFNCNFV